MWNMQVMNHISHPFKRKKMSTRRQSRTVAGDPACANSQADTTVCPSGMGGRWLRSNAVTPGYAKPSDNCQKIEKASNFDR
jgi:hypothetical protein